MYGGEQRVYQHASKQCQCDMQFGLFMPPQVLAADDSKSDNLEFENIESEHLKNQALNLRSHKVPVLFWLSGLTCTEQNFIAKAGAQRIAAQLGVILVIPDTSPRGEHVPDEDRYDFGSGAGFYVDATESPWSDNYRMYSYIVDELPALLDAHGLIDSECMGVFGHSMGGHGALTIHLNNPQKFKSVSAFAPIVAPTQVDWGTNALAGYLGSEGKQKQWAQYDSCALVQSKPSNALLLVEQGTNDEFIHYLKPELLAEACKLSGQAFRLNMREGYDHSYHFIATFIESHIRHHFDAITRTNIEGGP